MKISSKEGAGGKKMQRFLDEMVISIFGHTTVGEIGLQNLDDGASFGDYIITTDGHTVQPVFFNGGNIGTLAACGTLNDVSVMGAQPLLITCSMILQAGFQGEDLTEIMQSMKASCDSVGAQIVAGDTKVVDDPISIYLTTTGVGTRWEGLTHNLETVRETRDYPYSFVADCGLAPGDAIIVSGSIGDHGISILNERESLPLKGDLSSDVAPVWDIVKAALETGGVTAMKDPTRGGLSGALNEMSEKSGFGIYVNESDIPVCSHTFAASEILGINPLDVANEGKVVMGVMEEYADDVLSAIQGAAYGSDAAIIGRVNEDKRVFLNTSIGTKRILDMPEGDPVPRVC